MTVAATYQRDVTLSVISFTLMGVDKVAACVHTQRVPERAFLGLALAGGGAGVLVGASTFRHKIRALENRILSGHPIFPVQRLGVATRASTGSHPAKGFSPDRC